MGTRDDVRNLITACRSVGVRLYADAVINHMVPSILLCLHSVYCAVLRLPDLR